MSECNDNIIAALVARYYVPILFNEDVYYGGSQMWFPADDKFSKDYLIHHYGCGTIACADLFLYLALQYNSHKNPLTEIALQGLDTAYYMDYMTYVHKINQQYTKTKRWLAVLGPSLASAINKYSVAYNLGYYARWLWNLTYYDMYEAILEMLGHNIPVILSIGPNTPVIWGKKGIPFYLEYSHELMPIVPDDNTPIPPDNSNKPVIIYKYKKVKQSINSHYVTITGIVKDDYESNIMLRISSWGKKYYINYEEYRDYISDIGGTFTSSMVYIK